jgi:hypothetical protein
MSEPAIREAVVRQRDACAQLGSPLMVRLLDGVLDDFNRGGPCAAALEGRSERPLHDAVPLRLLGTVHRLVLAGRAPDLARFYPSAGGDDPGDPVPALLATIAAHPAEIAEGLRRPVQTNEVGRAAVLAGGFAEIARRTGLPLRQLEVGASAGLLLRWDGYRYDTGRSVLGDPASPLQFTGVWEGDPPDLDTDVVVAGRRGCDIAPLAATTPAGRLTLRSFVWPDQAARLARLDAALAVAATRPVSIDAEDAATWAPRQLARPSPGQVTVVHHSIVLQYLARPSFQALRDALRAAGGRATLHAPLAWLRMEPAGSVADLRLTLWPGGGDEVLATCGYHGEAIRWRRAR